jgi:hypothetical protein
MNRRTVSTALCAVALCASTRSVQGQSLRLSGESTGDLFGWSVAPAGDVDGDGFDDVVVGAPAHASVAGFAGRSYLFLGPFTGPRNAAQADARFSATTFGDNLGFSVAGAGDIDADGFDDLLLGARSHDGAGIQAGRVYLFRGPVSGNRTDAQADATISGRAFDELGRAVARGGDLNGDGIDDLLVGAPLSSVGASSAGEAHVFFGPISGHLSVTQADASIAGVTFNELLGTSLAAGDLDGDGHDDMIVGAPRPPLNGTGTGRVYIRFGPVAGVHSAATSDVVFVGESANDEFGSSVALGDVNGDARLDLVVGASQFFTNSSGKAYVFYGPLQAGVFAAAQADAILLGEQGDDAFGTSVACGADVNGDGFDDVTVGAPSNGAGGILAGRTYTFFGPLSGTRGAASAERILTGAALDALGHSCAAAPSLQDDGGDGLLLGAAPHPNSASAGYVEVEQPAVPVVAFCFGDGSGSACPCGNEGDEGRGCANSVEPDGALLRWTGVASVASDTLVLHGSGMPDGTALYFQGTSRLQSGAGVVFGDGLRCAGGAIVRLATKLNSSGASQYPAGADAALSVRGATVAGDVRVYQVWYRNPAAFCQPTTFNFSGALEVTWAP